MNCAEQNEAKQRFQLWFNQDDTSKGAEVFDWLVEHGPNAAAAEFVLRCCCCGLSEDDSDDERCLLKAAHFFAGGDVRKLDPIVDCLASYPDCCDVIVDAIGEAIDRWWMSSQCSSPLPAPEIPKPSSGEWLELFGIELEIEGAEYPVNEGPIDECDLGQDFQRWRREVKPFGDMSFREWMAPQLPVCKDS